MPAGISKTAFVAFPVGSASDSSWDVSKTKIPRTPLENHLKHRTIKRQNPLRIVNIGCSKRSRLSCRQPSRDVV